METGARALGFIWILGIVTYLVFGTDAPITWKIAWAEYGGIGLIHTVGIWRGKDGDDAWNRRMRRVHWTGILAAGGLFLIGALVSR